MENTLNTPKAAVIPTTTRLGHVHLTVANLDRQIQFYTQVLGFQLHWREGSEAALGTAAEVLLRLTENPAAYRVQHTTGMYHFAILYPSRKELARAIARLFVLRYPNSPTDHGVSKTTYLDDLEGNTIELYVRSLDDAKFEIVNGQMIVRYADGRVGSGRDPLDLDALFSELTDEDRLDLPLPEGTTLGHMHLYTSSLEKSMDFYAGILGYQEGPMIPSFRMGEVGLDEQQNHVIAFNTWKGEGAPPAPPDVLGMRYFTIVLPTADELQRVIDRLTAAGLLTEQTTDGTLVRDPSHLNIILTDHLLPVKP
ncbi:MAG: VOC family protein [Chloroflexi bacterium]|nr:VOC family protein [Chloroflexota bacterium]MCC6895173.1 VOC family protein [Anaerolineae bacterium]